MKQLSLQLWWMLALRGAIAVAFGILAFIWPGVTLLSLLALFAAYALLGGAVSIYGAIKNRKLNGDWWLPLLFGVVSLCAGVVAVVHPALTALVLVLLIAANALATGALDIVTAIRLRTVIDNEWLLVLNGVTSILFGVLVFLFPGAGALALIWAISLYALLSGCLLLWLAFRLRSMAKARSSDRDRRVTPDRRMRTAH